MEEIVMRCALLALRTLGMVIGVARHASQRVVPKMIGKSANWSRRTQSALIVAALTAAGAVTTASVAHAETRTFIHTGGEQRFIVPPSVTKLSVVAIGGRGGAGHAGGSGGFGARALAELAVTPGQLLFVMVGGNGMSGQTNAMPAPGGFNGGGIGGASGGGPCHGGGGGG